MLKRVCIAILCIFLSSLILAIISYTPLSERNPDTYYEPFGAGIWVFIMFLTPAYFLGGIPASFLIDKRMKNKMVQGLSYLAAGFLAGCLVFLVYFLLLGNPINSLFIGFITNYGLLGACGACLFFFIKLLIDLIIKVTSSK
ncbi:MAG TPA: hypothetical protein VFK37_09560 [Bacillales bacterium]|nr:hypothetical protein [Bacillales bacterium]